ncbi:MAG: FG-GAP repeat domain-containing protein [Candidatus Zixiibacteriota bacterium]
MGRMGSSYNKFKRGNEIRGFVWSPRAWLIPGLLGFSLLLALTVTPARAADQDHFRVQELSIDGWMLGALVGDFNGDNLGDLALIYLPAAGDDMRRFIGLFSHDRTTGFGSRPTHITPLPTTASQFQVVDVQGDGADEIVFVDDRGVQSLSWSGTEGFSPSVRVARRQSVYQAGVFRGALMSDFALEINGLPGPEFVIPTAAGVAIYEAGENGVYELLNEIALKSVGTHADVRQLFRRAPSRSYVIEPPEVKALDANLDGRLDLYFLWSDHLYVFLQDETGNFPRTADQEITLSSPALRESCYPLLVDCNGDGRPDLVALRLQGGISAAECKVDFYHSDQTGRLASVPNKSLSLSQARTSMILTDIDGDGLPELALPAVELGAVSTIKMMMQKRGGLYLLIYDLQNGLPNDEATVRKKFSFALDFETEAPDEEVIFDWSADYNNDGLMDLVFSTGDGNLEIYYGAGRGFIEADPSIETPLVNAGGITPYELNRDGRSDLVVERVNSGRVNGVWALLSK